MRLKRVVWFFFMIGLGLGMGLVFGWFVQPLPKAAPELDTLSADYKADFVLMTAEIYHADQDLDAAAARLRQLDDQPADSIAAAGLATARQLAYSVDDLALMEHLYRELYDQAGAPETESQP